MAPEIVTIKGTKNGLVILLRPEAGYKNLKEALHTKIESARGFFQGAKFALASNSSAQLTQDQQSELVALCRQYGLEPSPVGTAVSGRQSPAAPSAPTQARPIRSPRSGLPTLALTRHLRSGQRIQFPGHVALVGDVHPGAEIVSGGHIFIVGEAKGLLHAGYPENARARIIAYRLDPIQLRIAQALVFSPLAANPKIQAAGPLMARLARGRIVIEPYHP